MERINAYSRPDGKGGIIVDLEGMAVDVVTVAKGAGYDREQFLANMAQTFDEVQVEVTRAPTIEGDPPRITGSLPMKTPWGKPH